VMNSYTETIEKGLSEANNVLLLSGNDQLEELRLAENTNSALERISKYEDMQEVSTSNEQKQCNNLETSNAIAQGNLDFENMQVPDSEDEAENENHRALSGPRRSCASSSQKNSYSCQIIQELADALISAKQLKVLDLSRNGLSDEAIQSLYSAWASVTRGDGMAQKHVNKDVVHFSVDGMRCCGMKPVAEETCECKPGWPTDINLWLLFVNIPN